MLNQKDFDRWCAANNIPRDTRTIIEQIRKSDPSRRVQSGKRSVSGRFPSSKMGVTIQFESHKNELPFIYELEHDSAVLEYYDQPPTIKLEYIGKNNRKQVVPHTPDFFIIKHDSAEWVECKTEDDLLKLSVDQPNRFEPQEGSGWICRPGVAYAQQFGLDYRLRSSSEINWKFQRNTEFLADYYRVEKPEVTEEAIAKVCDVVSKEPLITLKDLINKVIDGKSVSLDDIYFLITGNVIFVDLYSCLLTEPENVLVYPSRETYNACGYVLRSGDDVNEKALASRVVNIVPNAELLWDGKGWKVINVGDRQITLMNGEGTIVPIPVETLKRLILNGDIQGIPKTSVETENDQNLKILSAAKESELKIANRRTQIVSASLAGRPLSELIPERTLRHWKAKYRNADEILGSGYLGLIPQTTKGNRNPKLPPLSLDLMDKAISDNYETLDQKSRRAAHLIYEDDCQKAAVISASYVTFCRYVEKRPKHEQVMKRKGKRASYATEKFIWHLDQDTPRHGERPFHIAHIDHTELDIELIDSKTGKNMGRPWLTMMIDAFSRRILAVYLTFQNPSKISCMMILRECVRRYGRLPQILIVDGGKEFASVYFEALLATYSVLKKTRPPAKARFGSVIERLFGTANKAFIHNLQGNTQATKDVRQVTKSNNPKNRAIWTLPELFDRLCEWAYEVYDETEHSTLNMTPAAAFAQGMLNAGERVHTIIPYNESFKLMTLPSTIKGTAKIDYQRGVKINRIFYWSDEFRVPGMAGRGVKVRFDPFDAGIAYAWVNSKWRECRSEHFSTLKGKSHREIYLATEILKKEKKGDVTVAKVVKFLKSTEAQQQLLRQRRMDYEQRPVLMAINNGGIVERKAELNSPDEAIELAPINMGGGDDKALRFSSLDEREMETDMNDDDLEIYEDL